ESFSNSSSNSYSSSDSMSASDSSSRSISDSSSESGSESTSFSESESDSESGSESEDEPCLYGECEWFGDIYGGWYQLSSCTYGQCEPPDRPVAYDGERVNTCCQPAPRPCTEATCLWVAAGNPLQWTLSRECDAPCNTCPNPLPDEPTFLGETREYPCIIFWGK